MDSKNLSEMIKTFFYIVERHWKIYTSMGPTQRALNFFWDDFFSLISRDSFKARSRSQAQKQNEHIKR